MDGLLNVGIGMMLIYLVGSLTVTAAVETVSSLLGLRGKTLAKSLATLFRDPAYRAQLIDHPLLATLRAAGAKPSYVPPRNVALAITNLTKTSADVQATIESVTAWAKANRNSDMGRIVEALLAEAGDDLAKLHAAIESWYADAMDRLGGDFKRQCQYIGIALGLVVAAALNIDSIAVFGSLLTSPHVAAAVGDIAAQAAAGPQPTVDQLPEVIEQLRRSGLPLGWPGGFAWDRVLPALPGWVISAFALSLGASFWFDTLQRFVRVRGTGPKPTEPAKS
jgi:hypothetical protein